MKSRKTKPPKVQTRGMDVGVPEPGKVAARIKRHLAAFMKRVEPDLLSLLEADGGFEEGLEDLRKAIEKLQKDLDGTVEYLNEESFDAHLLRRNDEEA